MNHDWCEKTAGSVLLLATLLGLISGACGEHESDRECHPVRAFPFDSDRLCVSEVAEVVGCTLDEIGTGAAPCVKRLSDGALFIATQGIRFEGSDQWGGCTSEEREMTLVFCAND
jgi:hypothetical protein